MSNEPNKDYIVQRNNCHLRIQHITISWRLTMRDLAGWYVRAHTTEGCTGSDVDVDGYYDHL